MVDPASGRGGCAGVLTRRVAILAIAAAVACSGGRREPGSSAGLGRRIVEGPVRAVKASADGAWLALLDGCSEARGQYLPPRTASCELRVVPSAGGAARSARADS